ncbi:long-chain fatty acid--CoA ligase [Pelistega sp. NLN82]|uniref:Long-chain fatty acid--CoA ligase n=1 Tax=Pelistega ratti TaxID=2652177 RepID=A0A6L9Y393_9BURK|nr:long-chain fatty acid--CoA ligase [Pelistega ratti]NEN74850.1 long-chain fatty acid--CoA ligase [Pelistega ratti]
MNALDFHFVNRIRYQSQKLGKKTALRYHKDNQWHDISWTDFQTQIDTLSLALLANHIDVQDKIGIFANNMPQWTIADFASLQIRAVTVPIYATNTAQQAQFIIHDADIKILFIGDQTQWDHIITILDQCPQLQRIVAMKDSIQLKDCPIGIHWSDFLAESTQANPLTLTQRLNSKQMDDLFTLIYTSGTTGDPKGVMLDYANLGHQLRVHEQTIDLREDDLSLSFLPFSHIFERGWLAVMIHSGITNCYLEDTNQVRYALTELRPTLMCAVPRLYEKIYTAVLDKVQQTSFFKRGLFFWAINVGKKRLLSQAQQKTISSLLSLQYAIADKLVLSKLRSLLGGRIRIMPSGGARLEPEIALFFHSIGINIKSGYGMTETTASISCWKDGETHFDSIGKLFPEVEVRIGEEDEILVRGNIVMRGYYKNPEATAAAFTTDGFFKTGDAGKLDSEGNLYMTDRIKELMKTSTGKYIAPQRIENLICKDKFIEQIAIIADAKKYVSALVVPCFEALEDYAKQVNIHYQTRLDLIKNTEILKLIEQRIQQHQKELASFEQIKKFTLLPQAFSTALNEITPTLKLKRKVILERYKTQIDAMYRS